MQVIWYDMKWYDMIWYGLVWKFLRETPLNPKVPGFSMVFSPFDGLNLGMVIHVDPMTVLETLEGGVTLRAVWFFFGHTLWETNIAIERGHRNSGFTH